MLYMVCAIIIFIRLNLRVCISVILTNSRFRYNDEKSWIRRNDVIDHKLINKFNNINKRSK